MTIMDLQEDRPLLRLAWQPSDRILEALAAFGLLVLIASAGYGLVHLPAKVPIHFNLSGQADAWGSRPLVVLLPGIAVVLYVMLSLLSRVPHCYNYTFAITPTNAEFQYLIARRLVLMMKAVIIWLFVGIYTITAQVATGHSPFLAQWLLPLTGAALGGPLLWYFRTSRRHLRFEGKEA